MDGASAVTRNTVEFGQRLKDARHRRGLSQAHLAVILGVSHAALSRWESGNRNPRAEHLEQVLRWLQQVDQTQTG
jgi:transcriptional regulator with XRE-family HTH domain